VPTKPMPLAVGARLPRNLLSQPLPEPAALRRIRLTEDARGFYVDGKAFDVRAGPAITARSGTVEEWTVVNDTEEVHAFHIHQVHFALERTNREKPQVVNWLDVVSVPSRSHYYGGKTLPGTVRLLVDFRDPRIRGTFLFHCHILDHEDRGMMAKIQVI
jgi:suppressor of ftsI